MTNLPLNNPRYRKSLRQATSNNPPSLLHILLTPTSQNPYNRRQNLRESTQGSRSGPTLQSSISFTTFLLSLFAASIGFLAFHQLTPPNSPLPLELNMPPSSSPRQGWKGNLTLDQEAKLKEFWTQLLTISGRLDKKPSETPDPDGTPQRKPSQQHEEDPSKKKKRFTFFGGRKASESGTGSSDAAADADDKHGQTKEFKAALAEQTPEQLRETIWAFTKADDPDALLLRFLRARKWDVHAALVMMISTNRWRSHEVHLDDDLLGKGEEHYRNQSYNASGPTRKLAEDFMAQLRMGKSFVHGTDREGRPICYVRVRLHKGGEFGEESLEKLTVYTIETTRMMLRAPVDTAVIVFDMTGFSMANMDYTPVKFMIKVFEANYPESLGAILVHRSPWLFHSIWNIIRGWLDPVVAAKVHFTNDVKDVSAFIEPSHVLKELGGEEDWEYEYVEPVAGENRLMQTGGEEWREGGNEKDRLERERWEIVGQFEEETARWARGEGGDDRTSKREELIQRLGTNYWALDPFVRARSYYDRTGVIGKHGAINMYPPTSLGNARAKPAEEKS